ncbi:hypothetical protein ACFVR1_11880 [Psychrobacillus sp. NPDC058041]|uniref:hypothetical protein n=1 Tax=Psychrobacillus sp. NPDC058041 TaxID=3346310 RepID=UPI0036DCD9E7
MINNYYKNKVRWCVICNQGWVEIQKEAVSNKLILCCCECESVWENLNDVNNPDKATSTDELLIEPNDNEIGHWAKYIIEN